MTRTASLSSAGTTTFPSSPCVQHCWMQSVVALFRCRRSCKTAGETPARTLRCLAPQKQLSQLRTPARHPNWEGHLVIARAVAERLRKTHLPIGMPLCPAEPAVLPEPLHAEGIPMPNSMCARGSLLRQFVVRSHGFQFSSERRGKPGLVGLTPGDNLSLALFNKYTPFAAAASAHLL